MLFTEQAQHAVIINELADSHLFVSYYSFVVIVVCLFMFASYCFVVIVISHF